MNVIVGTLDGTFQVSYRPRKCKDFKNIKLDKANLKESFITALKKADKEEEIDNMLYSSSMDFPEEYGVTHKEVSNFTKMVQELFGKEQ